MKAWLAKWWRWVVAGLLVFAAGIILGGVLKRSDDRLEWGTVPEVLAVVVGGASALVAAWAALAASQSAAETRKLVTLEGERRDEERAEKRAASLRVEVAQGSTPSNYLVAIVNDGPGQAKAVTPVVQPAPGITGVCYLDTAPFPETLAPRASRVVNYATTSRSHSVHITWDDGNGPQEGIFPL